MTTDTVPKQAVFGGLGWSVGGFAKGAGMLAPELATMLVVLTTDAVADAATLDAALRSATAATFDRLDSDGCMSTNDTVLLLASGASGVTPPADELATAVQSVCADLALQLLADAEGASKEIRIDVVRAASEAEAVTGARAVSRSNLFKCAVHGNDPNWGRVLSALGTTDITFEPDRVDVTINGVKVARGGAAGDDRSLVDLSGREVVVSIDLAAGSSSAQRVDQRPHRRVRPRELGLLLMTTTTRRPGGTPGHSPRRSCSPRRCPGWRPSTAARSW